MSARLTFIHALSALHPGTGQGAGVIDLPIAREKSTGIPYLPGSSLKGALRSRAYTENTPNRDLIFGPDQADGEESRASLIQISDQKVLLLPVRSLAGTFAWVTSPYILHRLVRDVKDVYGKQSSIVVPQDPGLPQCYVAEGENASALVLKTEKDGQTSKKVYLEDLDLEAVARQDVNQWASWIGQHVFPRDDQWQVMLQQRLCIVHDDVFNFILTTATEIITRTRLNDDSKTVTDGGLWYEEALPTETILSGLILATPLKGNEKQLSVEEIFERITTLTNVPMQLGGKATVGRGLCQVRISEE